MLIELDKELFPDDCEVAVIPPHDMQVYLVQKNGSSSLRYEVQKNGYQLLKNKQLVSLEHIDIFLRDPRERYLSGINTYVQHLLRDHPDLDRKTCVWFAKRYNFLNRHYLPQWHWLLNLSRFINPSCLFRFHDLADLKNVTKIKSRAGIIPPDQNWESFVFENNQNIELWFLLDYILMGYRGQQISWSELLEVYKKHPVQPLKLVAQSISCTVLD